MLANPSLAEPLENYVTPMPPSPKDNVLPPQPIPTISDRDIVKPVETTTVKTPGNQPCLS